MNTIDLLQLILIGVLVVYCALLQDRLNKQTDWMMNHSGWLKAHSNWLKALTVLHKLDLPEGYDGYIAESLSGTPEDTIAASMDIADRQWVTE
jgi:hypothetical protein